MSANTYYQHISALVNIKFCYFGCSLERFDYLAYGAINTYHKDYATFGIVGQYDKTYMGMYTQQDMPPGAMAFPVSKIDTSIEFISSDSAKKYRNAVLPKGVDSIDIKIKTREDEKTTTGLEDAKLAKSCSNILRWWINKVTPNFLEVVKCVITDLLDYGNAACEYRATDTVVLKHLPFQQCFFGNKNPKDFSFVFRDTISESKALEYGDKPLNGDVPHVVDYLYISKNIMQRLAAKDSEGYAPTFAFYKIIYSHTANQEIYAESLNTNPIFIARQDITHTFAPMNTHNQLIYSDSFERGIYGRGAGIKSLGHIMQANLALQLKTNASILSLYPSILITLGTEINTDTEVEGRLDISPGRTNTMRTPSLSSLSATTGASPNFTVISDPQHVIVSFNETYQTHIKQIENAYNTSIFSLLNETGRNPTATEITIRSQETAQTFKGEASSFYNELLLPLLTAIVNDILSNPNIAMLGLEKEDYELFKELKTKNWHIKIFSFEDERNQLANEELLKSRIATLAQLAPMVNQGLDIPNLQSMMQDLIQQYTDLVNDK